MEFELSFNCACEPNDTFTVKNFHSDCLMLEMTDSVHEFEGEPVRAQFDLTMDDAVKLAKTILKWAGEENGV